MKKIKLTILFITIILISTSLFAQLEQNISVKNQIDIGARIGDIQSFTLNNGLQVIVVENHVNPTISYQLLIDVDPIIEKESKGFVSLTGELLRAGTKNKSATEINNSLKSINANLTTYENGVCGVTSVKNREEFLDIFSDVILNPTFPENELIKAKKATASELGSSEKNPVYVANRVGKKLRNQHHPYCEITSTKTINNITREHLIKYYSTYYKPNISYLVMVGDIKFKQAQIDAQKYFNSWQKAEVPSHEYQFPNKNIGTRVVFIHDETVTRSCINITYSVNLKPGDHSAVAASLANELLYNSLSNLQEDNHHISTIYSAIKKDNFVGYFNLLTQLDTEATIDVMDQIIAIMNRMKNVQIDTNTLSFIKEIRNNNFIKTLDNPKNIAQLAFNSIKYNLPSDYYQTYKDKVEKVTVEQIQSVSKKYIDPDQAIIIVVGNNFQLRDSLKKFSASGKVEDYDIYGNPVIEEQQNSIPKNVSAQSVLDNYIDVIGGKEKLKKIDDITIVATSNTNGMEIKQKTYRKAPNKYAMITSMNGTVMMQQAFNGERAVMKGFQGEKEIIGKDLENIKIDAILNIELKYDSLGFKTTLKNIEKINKKDAYKIKVVSPTGKTTFDYFDTESGLKLQSKQTINSPQGEFTQKQNFSDYQEVDSVKFPFHIKISGVQNMELKVDSIIINTGLSDDLF